MKLKFSFLTLFVIFSANAVLAALEVPLVLRWNSANTFSYAPDQQVKEIAWSEFYRLDMGIDSLRYHELSLNLEVRSKANFINTYLDLYQADITYHADIIDFGAEIKPSGYALEYQLHPSRIINPDMDDHLFLPTRFNGIFIAYPSAINIKLEAGGNFYNLATGRLTEKLPLFNKRGAISLIQEIQTFDSHWHKPVVIGAAEFNYESPDWAISSTAAAAYYPEYDSRPSDFTPFFHFETNKTLVPGFSLYLQGIYKELNPDKNSHKSIDAALGKKLSKFMLSAGSKLDYIHKNDQLTPYLVLKWIPSPGQQLGAYYRCILSDSGSDLHQAGLTAELSFGF
ncbi:MAG: hypothetical protein KA984_05135 [Candidatus Cloacimonetes bacterium]|nr:hypothetical protein [Candidatus Cloacimonadota bacterium]